MAAPISYSLSKVTLKAAEKNGLMVLINPHSVPCFQYPGQSGVMSKQMVATTENTHDRG